MEKNQLNQIVISLGALALLLPSLKLVLICSVLAPLAFSVLLNAISRFRSPDR